MKICLTGIAGFIGSYCAKHFVDICYTVTGIDIPGVNKSRLASIEDNIKFIEQDLAKALSFNEIVDSIQPDVFIHLAFQIPPRNSLEGKDEAFRVNYAGMKNVLNGLKKSTSKPLLIWAGSSAQYGFVKDEENPINEDQPFRPMSEYGVHKIAQEMLAIQNNLCNDYPIIRLRFFNIIGPEQSPGFICPDLTKKVVEIETGKSSCDMEIGNLSTIRDFTDVRDVATAYEKAIQYCVPGEVYNICSGKGVTMQSVLDFLLQNTSSNISIIQRKLKPGKYDVPRQIGDNKRFRELTGWTPQITFDQSMTDILAKWRQRIKK